MAGIEQVIFMNMCMLEDENGRVLALDKVSESYSGTTFPGGHVEPGESFKDAMIREFFEETGLTIRNPELRGLYHWKEGEVRNIGLMYRAAEYEGKLRSSEEGRVYWVTAEEFLNKPLAYGMKEVWNMMHDDSVSEVMQVREGDGWEAIIP